MATIVDGIVIGAAGGAIAGLTVWVVQYAHDIITQKIESNRIYQWLTENTTPEPGEGDQFKSTRAIASWNNLTEDRVRQICSVDSRIYLSTGAKENMWGIHDRVQPSIYEKQGVRTI